MKPLNKTYSQAVNKDHPRERQNMVFIQCRQVVFICRSHSLISEKFSKCGLYLHDGLYSEVVLNTVLTVHNYRIEGASA